MARRSGLLAIVLLLTGLATGCSKPTASSPDFPFTGSWTGRYTDHLMVNSSTLEPLTVILSMNVAADGSATGNGQKSIEGFVDRITMSVTVLPDGAVSGTGHYALFYSGLALRSLPGEVVGQLDAATLKGSGAFCALWDGLPVHFPWTLERVP